MRAGLALIVRDDAQRHLRSDNGLYTIARPQKARALRAVPTPRRRHFFNRALRLLPRGRPTSWDQPPLATEMESQWRLDCAAGFFEEMGFAEARAPLAYFTILVPWDLVYFAILVPWR